MSYLILLTGILLLILLTTWAKLNTFLSLLVSMGIGLANGMSIDSVTHAVQTGMGDMLGSLIVIIVVGAMIGKLIAEYGCSPAVFHLLCHGLAENTCMGVGDHGIHCGNSLVLWNRICSARTADHHPFL
jgi:Gnt-I system high-affinity gluconate transporter